jgi:hypothetical protein
MLFEIDAECRDDPCPDVDRVHETKQREQTGSHTKRR